MAKKTVETSTKLQGQELVTYHNENVANSSMADLAAGAGYVSAKGKATPTAYEHALLKALGMTLPSTRKARSVKQKELNTTYSIKVQANGNVNISAAYVKMLETEEDTVKSFELISDGTYITLSPVFTTPELEEAQVEETDEYEDDYEEEEEEADEASLAFV